MGDWVDLGTVVVTDVIGPGPEADHGPTEFDPDQEWQEHQVAEIWTRRSHNVDYLGDWHTHVDGPARPSRIDLAAALKIQSSPEARAPRPLLLVIQLDHNGSLNARAFVLTGRRLRRARVSISTSSDTPQ